MTKIGTAEIDFLAKDLATKVIDRIGKKVDELDKKVKKQSASSKKGFDNFSDSIKGLAGTLGLATVAGTAAFALKNFTVESTRLAFQMEGLENAFNRLAGQSAPELLMQLNRASMGTVANIDAIGAANRAMLLGIDAEALPQMMEIARAASQAMGTDVTAAFNDIATGIGRQSKLILDNLGIIIDVESANRKYAEGLGTTSAELTDLEKKQAFLNEALRIGTENMNNMGGAINSNKEDVQALTAEWKNFKTDTGEIFTTYLGTVAKRLRLTNKIAEEGGVKGKLFSKFGILFQTEYLEEYANTLDYLNPKQETYNEVLDEGTEIIKERVDESIRLAQVSDEYKFKLESLQGQYESGAISASKLFLEQENLRLEYESDIDKITKILALEKDRTKELTDQATATRDLTTAQKDLVDAFGSASEFEKNKKEIMGGDVGATDTVKQLFGIDSNSTDGLKTKTESVAETAIQKVIEKNKELNQNIQEATNSTNTLNNKFRDSATLIQQMTNNLGNVVALLNSIDGAYIRYDVDVSLPRTELRDVGG